MSAEHSRIGWLGVGRMGATMAGRLIGAGEDVTVWNRTRAKAEAIPGAKVADTIRDLAALDIVFIMVSTPKDLEQVVTGDEGLLAGSALPKIIVDCSTVDTSSSAAMREAVESKGVQFLAAPISGNPHVVSEGGAVMVASGPEETFRQVEPLLKTIAKDAVWVGPAEQARLVKIAHNLYLGMLAQTLSEVTTLAEKAGVPREAFLQFFNSTVLATEWGRKRTPDLLANDWTPTFTTELLRKDFDLGLAAARAAEVPMPLAAATMQLLQTAIGRGYRDQDFLALFEMQAASAGMDSRASRA